MSKTVVAGKETTAQDGRDEETHSRQAHLIFLVILQAVTLYSTQAAAFADFSLSNGIIILHSIVVLMIPLVVYVFISKLLRKIRSFNFYLESQAALWSTCVLILHPTLAHRTLGINQYYIFTIVSFASYLLIQKESTSSTTKTPAPIPNAMPIFMAYLAILAIFACFTAHPGITFVGCICISAWLQVYIAAEVPKVVAQAALGLAVVLLLVQHLQLLPSTKDIAPQCESMLDHFGHFIYYLINFGNKLVGFCLPINLFSRDYNTNIFITKKDTAFDIAEKLLNPYEFAVGLLQYVFFAKESKHINLQKPNAKFPSLFHQDDGNLFLTELWVVFSLVVVVVAIKTIVLALWKLKKQPALLHNLHKQKSVLFVVAMLLSFDTIHQSWQFDPKFLSLEDIYSSGFDLSVVLFTLQLGILFADGLFSSMYHVDGRDRDYDVVNPVNKTRNVVMVAKPKAGETNRFEVYCPKHPHLLHNLAKVLHVAAVLAALFLLSRTL